MFFGGANKPPQTAILKRSLPKKSSSAGELDAATKDLTTRLKRQNLSEKLYLHRNRAKSPMPYKHGDLWYRLSCDYNGASSKPFVLLQQESKNAKRLESKIIKLPENAFENVEFFAEARGHVEEINALFTCDLETLEQVERDLPRTYPEIEYFENTDNLDTLRRILIALAAEYPQVGYVQGMNFLAAHLLLHTKNEDSTFLLLRRLMEHPRYMLQHLFIAGLPKLITYSKTLDMLVKGRLPELYSHLHEIGLEPLFYSQHWIITLFTYMMPFDHLAIVWDMFFDKGWESIFKVSICILQVHEEELKAADFERCAQILRDAAGEPHADLPFKIEQLDFTESEITAINKAVNQIEPLYKKKTHR